MCVVSYDSCGIAGNNFYLNFQLTQQDGVTPEDLTGSSVELQLLNSDCSELAVKNMNGGVVSGSESDGLVSFFLDGTETQALLPVTPVEGCVTTKVFVGDVRVTWQDNTKEVLLRLNAEFKQGRNR